MAVETATKISDLDANLPDPSDPLAEGDDHIRLLKAVLKTQFTNMPDILDYAADITARFVALEASVTALQASINDDVVLKDGSGNVAITGLLTVNSVVVQTTFVAQSTVDITGAMTFTTANGTTLDATDINASGTLTSDGNVIAYEGS